MPAFQVDLVVFDFGHRKNIVEGFLDFRGIFQNAAGFVVQEVAEPQTPVLHGRQVLDQSHHVHSPEPVRDVFFVQPFEKGKDLEQNLVHVGLLGDRIEGKKGDDEVTEVGDFNVPGGSGQAGFVHRPLVIQPTFHQAGVEQGEALAQLGRGGIGIGARLAVAAVISQEFIQGHGTPPAVESAASRFL
ncbi:MAG: hypothetical protein GWN10_08195 [Nitrospinaceae bacterium]|nr:hypothetical protein [Nitrospinaceae bacterium]